MAQPVGGSFQPSPLIYIKFLHYWLLHLCPLVLFRLKLGLRSFHWFNLLFNFFLFLLNRLRLLHFLFLDKFIFFLFLLNTALLLA